MRRCHGTILALAALLCSLPLSSPLAAQEWVYTVRPGDNLWSVTERFAASMRYWKPLQELNQVRNPLHLQPGTRLRIPLAWLRRQPEAVRILALSGEVSVQPMGGTPERLEQTAALRVGDRIRTGPKGSVSLEFADGSRLLMLPDSELVFDIIRAFGDTGMVDSRAHLERGRVATEVSPSRGPGSHFEISTPVAFSAVRGTELRVASGGTDDPTSTEVLTGQVAVTGSGQTTNVDAGFGTVVRAGEPPAPPRPLLPPPDLSALPMRLDRIPLRIDWPALSGAVRYRIQLAANPSFATLLIDTVVRAPRFLNTELPDGDYAIRVRGIDALGLEGKNATHTFTLDARPQPPFLVAPTHEATVREPRPEFRWTATAEVQAYRLQLATDADFADLVLDQPDLGGPRQRVEQELPPGVYFWRVASVQEGEEGPFSDPSALEVRLIPGPPSLGEATLSKRTVVVRWRAGVPGQRYRYQLAEDPNFEHILVADEVAEPRIELRRPLPGSYFLRVQTVDVDGFVGPFGPAQQVEIPPVGLWPALIPITVVVLLLVL